MRRIGIFNCYWSTRGGGELHAGAIAEVLSKDHRVDLIGIEPIDVEDLASTLNLDLSRTRFRRWPAPPDPTLPRRTSDFDLFINTTFWSNLPSRARDSAYLTFFPQPLLSARAERIARPLRDYLRPRTSPALTLGRGFYGIEGDRVWTRATAILTVAPRALRKGPLRLRFWPNMPWSLGEAIREVSAPGLDWTIEGDELVLEGPPEATEPVEVELRCRTHTPHGTSDTRELGVCLDLRQERRSLGARILGRMQRELRFRDPAFVPTYRVVMANSQYTRRWIRRRWGRDSEVLPPPVDTRTFRPPDPEEKRPVILSVGRFFHGAHNKKHPRMLQVFRRMCDRGDIPSGWELHLVGNVHRARLADLEYWADVERLAEGYPVKLLPDLPFPRLLEEYRRASIFWHAAGWGESEHRHPEKLEHFGLTTCEAMSSGCVPVVIAKAGQLEIVRDGVSGFFFRNANELRARTRQLIGGYGQSWMAEMMRVATDDVQRYSRDAFEKRLLTITHEHRLLG